MAEPPSAEHAPPGQELPPAKARKRLDPLLALTVLVGLALRLAGLGWGLPNREHLYSYHPDEVILVGAAVSCDPLAGDFDPQFYNYGSLSIFLLRAAYDVVEAVARPAQAEWALRARFHKIGRGITVLMGTVTLLLVYAIGRRLGGRPAGLVAAALLAVAPAHVVHSHYLTVDVPAAFWAAAALLAALRLLDAPRCRTAALAGACAGLAAATKYNACLVVLAPLAAVALNARPARGAAARAGACLAAAALAFLAGCPGVLLNTSRFLADFAFEARHVQTGHENLFVNTLPAWLYHVVVSLRFGLGLPLLAVVLAGVVFAARRRSRADLVMAAWVLPYYLLIGSAQVKFLRYTLPLFPPLAAWAGVACADWLGGALRSRARALAAALLVGVGFWTLGSAVAAMLLFVAPDPRDAAGDWVRQNVPAGTTVGLSHVPWFYTPPLVPWNGGPLTRESFYANRDQWPYAFRVSAWNRRLLAQNRPECLIFTDLEVRDALRLGLPGAAGLAAALGRYYDVRAFAPVAAWPGLLRPGTPPEDWLYAAPTVRVYFRRR